MIDRSSRVALGCVVFAMAALAASCGDSSDSPAGGTTTGTTTGGGGETGSGGGSGGGLPDCGDGTCGADESCSTCEADCGSCCGDGTCSADELCGTCPADCGECTGAPITVTRGPYLQSGSSDRVVVRWRTADPSESVVAWGSAADALTHVANTAGPTVEHEVEVTGLTADAIHHYAFGAPDSPLVGGDGTHFVRTPPVKGKARPTRIWVLGDSGTANQNARDVRDAYLAFTGARGSDLLMMLGDNAYDDGTDAEYQAAVFDMYPEILKNTVLYPTLGNHDGHSADSGTQSGPYYDVFTMPKAGEAGGVPSGTEAYYAFDYGNVHFVCLDSYDSDTDPGGDMLTWLANDLDANDQPWLVAFWHQPPYTKGSHDSDAEGDLAVMRENALPILEAHGVDLVLCGHSHAYERSFLLNGHYGDSASFAAAMKIDGGDGRKDGDGAYARSGGSKAGAVYVVAGSSGQTGGGSLDHPAMFISLNELGSLVLDFDEKVLDSTFVDDVGTKRDWFTIEKP